MNIITWNINRFDGTWDWFHQKCDIALEGRKSNRDEIVQTIKKYICGNDDIGILQEFPFKKNEFLIFQEEFKNAGLRVIHWCEDKVFIKKKECYAEPKNLTVAVITNTSHWKLVDPKIDFGEWKCKWENDKLYKLAYVNQYIELKNDFLNNKILGLHINPNDAKVIWDEILNKAGNYTYIIGDFNFNEYKSIEGGTENFYGKLQERNFRKIIDKSIVTYNPENSLEVTSVDNIFISNDTDYYFLKKEICNFCTWDNNKKRNLRLSDHYMCMVSLE